MTTPSSTITRRDYNEWLEFCKQVQDSTSVTFNENEEEQTKRIARAKRDYNYFVQTYFPIYADAKCATFQIEFANALIKDLNFMGVAEWAREHAKSVHLTVIIPMWLIAHDELTGMILMGKNNDDAANLLGDVQAQLQYNDLFAHDFSEQYNFGSWEEGEFTTKKGLLFKALGRKQSPRGLRKNEKRPNYAVVDDVDDDELVQNPRLVKKVVNNILGALLFALSIKGSRLVVAGNRISNNSVVANMVGDVKPGMPKREGLFHSKVSAIINYGKKNERPAWPERYTLKELYRKIKKAGPILANREFFHKTDIEGEIFKNEYFRWGKIPHLGLMEVIVGYFDPSFENKVTSDYKAWSVWGLRAGKKYCIKRFTRRAELDDAFEAMIDFEKTLPVGVGVIWYVEKQFFNRPIKNALARVKRSTAHPLIVITDTRTKENKYTRMVKMSPDYASGNVVYNEAEVHDIDMIQGNIQVKGIEPGYKTPDDAPDCDEGAWHYLDKHISFEEIQEHSASFGAFKEDNENRL